MNPTYDFSIRVALITGGGSGIGFAAAKAFAEAGGTAALADINQAALRALTAELTAARHHATYCGVGDESQAGGWSPTPCVSPAGSTWLSRTPEPLIITTIPPTSPQENLTS